MEKKINLIVKESEKNVRVDVFINKQESDLSRTRVKNLILDKKLRLNDKVLSDPSKKISGGDILELTIPLPKIKFLILLLLRSFSLLLIKTSTRTFLTLSLTIKFIFFSIK